MTSLVASAGFKIRNECPKGERRQHGHDLGTRCEEAMMDGTPEDGVNQHVSLCSWLSFR